MILNDQIKTTEAKAKAIRADVEKLITIAKKKGANAEHEIHKKVPNKEVVNVPLKSSDLLAVNNVPTSNSDVSKIENLLIYKIQLGAYQERDIDFSRREIIFL